VTDADRLLIANVALAVFAVLLFIVLTTLPPAHRTRPVPGSTPGVGSADRPQESPGNRPGAISNSSR
jgi:hypothetical protein